MHSLRLDELRERRQDDPLVGGRAVLGIPGEQAGGHLDVRRGTKSLLIVLAQPRAHRFPKHRVMNRMAFDLALEDPPFARVDDDVNDARPPGRPEHLPTDPPRITLQRLEEVRRVV